MVHTPHKYIHVYSRIDFDMGGTHIDGHKLNYLTYIHVVHIGMTCTRYIDPDMGHGDCN